MGGRNEKLIEFNSSLQLAMMRKEKSLTVVNFEGLSNYVDVIRKHAIDNKYLLSNRATILWYTEVNMPTAPKFRWGYYGKAVPYSFLMLRAQFIPSDFMIPAELTIRKAKLFLLALEYPDDREKQEHLKTKEDLLFLAKKERVERRKKKMIRNKKRIQFEWNLKHAFRAKALYLIVNDFDGLSGYIAYLRGQWKKQGIWGVGTIESYFKCILYLPHNWYMLKKTKKPEKITYFINETAPQLMRTAPDLNLKKKGKVVLVRLDSHAPQNLKALGTSKMREKDRWEMLFDYIAWKN